MDIMPKILNHLKVTDLRNILELWFYRYIKDKVQEEMIESMLMNKERWKVFVLCGNVLMLIAFNIVYLKDID